MARREMGDEEKHIVIVLVTKKGTGEKKGSGKKDLLGTD